MATNRKFMGRQRARVKRQSNFAFNRFANRPMTPKEVRKVSRTRYAQRKAGFSV